MASIIKVDQIQSDTGSINLASSISGNLTFSGTGKRILGDFSSSPIGNRTMFQTTGTNLATNIYAIPNGTATTATFSTANNSDASNSAILQMVSTSTAHKLQTAAVGTGTHLPIVFATGGTDRLTIPVDAAGIQFPATQAASSDPNTLDDYEEGTFTVGISGAGGPTITSQYCTYIKIGQVVTVNIRFNIRQGTASGTQSILNLPFASNAGDANYKAVGIGHWSASATGFLALWCTVGNGSTSASMYRTTTAATTPTGLQGSDWPTGSDTEMVFTLTYRANA